MLKTELLEVIANGENSGVEFKRDDIRPETFAKEIVAMANLRGGMVLLGVEDDGTISGIQREDLETWVMDTVFGRYVHPMLLPFYDLSFEEIELLCRVTADKQEGSGGSVDGGWFANFMDARKEQAR